MVLQNHITLVCNPKRANQWIWDHITLSQKSLWTLRVKKAGNKVSYSPRCFCHFHCASIYAYKNLRTLRALYCDVSITPKAHTVCSVSKISSSTGCSVLDGLTKFFSVLWDYHVCICSRCLIWIIITILTGLTLGRYHIYCPHKTHSALVFDSGQYESSLGNIMR